MRLIVKFSRACASMALFGVFAAGSLVVSLVMLVVRRPEGCQRVVRATWRLMVFLFEATRLIRLTFAVPPGLSGRVIVANHPSLIDVVLIVAKVPRTLPVAKSGLLRNPFVATIVRAMTLPDDATLPVRAAAYLKKGWNVLVFPEGTRTPADGVLRPFHRGAAQLALRAQAPVSVLRIDFAQRLLGKYQWPWQMHDRRVEVTIRAVATVDPARRGASLRGDAQRLTDEIRRCLEA